MKDYFKSISFPYVLGVICQVLAWCLVFMLIISVLIVGYEFTEFRYVGF